LEGRGEIAAPVDHLSSIGGPAYQTPLGTENTSVPRGSTVKAVFQGPQKKRLGKEKGRGGLKRVLAGKESPAVSGKKGDGARQGRENF